MVGWWRGFLGRSTGERQEDKVAASGCRCYIYVMPRPGKSITYAKHRPQPPGTLPAALLESLERSKAQAEAGVSVPLEPALHRLRASIARIRTQLDEVE